jgi:hypothetical protein
MVFISFLVLVISCTPRISIPHLPFLFPLIFSLPLEHWTRVLELRLQRFNFQAPATTSFGFVSESSASSRTTTGAPLVVLQISNTNIGAGTKGSKAISRLPR